MAGVYKLVSCDDPKDVTQELRSVIYHAYKAEEVMTIYHLHRVCQLKHLKSHGALLYMDLELN